MSELKTLKDLNIIKGKVHALGGEVGVDELKAEAVKWVKAEYWNEFWNWLKDKKNVKFGNDFSCVEFASWLLEYIFNISEEDLDDGL